MAETDIERDDLKADTDNPEAWSEPERVHPTKEQIEAAQAFGQGVREEGERMRAEACEIVADTDQLLKNLKENNRPSRIDTHDRLVDLTRLVGRLARLLGE